MIVRGNGTVLTYDTQSGMYLVELGRNTMSNEPSKVDARIQQYVGVRDMIAKLKERQEAELKPLLEIQEQLSGWLQQFLTTNNLDNVKTAYGTAHTTTRYTASLADPALFMNFVKEKGEWDLLDRRANATAVKEYVQAHNELPPGCNLSSIKTVGVRRPSKGAADITAQ